jgi:Alginate export
MNAVRRLLHGYVGVLVVAMPAVRADEACVLEPARLRFEDDHGCFRDAENRDGFPGEIKWVPLDRDRQMFLSVGGEIRQRYEYTRDPLFGADVEDRSGVWLQRFALHGDLDFGPHFRVFGQLSSALERGSVRGPSPVDENELALQNAFVDVKVPLGPDADLALRGGRQELHFGSGRLVDVREGPNVRRTFDAVRATVELAGWRVDALAGRPRRPLPGVFDDEANDDQALWGVYAVGSDGQFALGGIELYYLGFEDDAGAFAQGIARERRHSIGARFYGEERGWDWNWETIYQFGSFGEGDIAAWTIASETGFTFERASWRPRIALSANIASGDGNPADADLGTFNALFPRGNYFSQAAVLGPRNFLNIHPFVTVRPTESWSLTADMNFFWRLDKQDGIYAPSGQLIRGPSGSGERFVGSALSLTSGFALADNLAFTAIYTHFFTGEFLRATGPSDDIDFFELTVQFKF